MARRDQTVFNKNEIKRIRQALRMAIDGENDFINAHHIGSYTNGGKYVGGRVPDIYKPLIASTKCTISAFNRLLIKTEPSK